MKDFGIFWDFQSEISEIQTTVTEKYYLYSAEKDGILKNQN